MAKDLNVMLKHLLKAPSKEAVVTLCEDGFLYRHTPEFPDDVILRARTILGITKGEAKQVLQSLGDVIKEAMFLMASEPKDVVNIFPDDFDANLKKLLAKIILQKFPSWKDSSLQTMVFMPQLISVTCQMEPCDSNLSDGGAAPPSLLQLKAEAKPAHRFQHTIQSLNMQLSQDQLSNVLEGLGKIRNQLSAVAQKN